MKILETDRLVLRTLQLDDIDKVMSFWGDNEVMKFCGGAGTKERELRALNFYINLQKESGFSPYIIESKENNVVMGVCGFNPPPIGYDAELMYHLSKKYWGLGYATEAARGCIEYARQNLKLSKIGASINPKNKDSEKVLVKLGFKFVQKKWSQDLNEEEAFFELNIQNKGEFMIKEIIYESVSDKHIKSAIELVIKNYNEERIAIPFLPNIEEQINILEEAIPRLFREGLGLAAMHNGKLVGFIAGFVVDNLWGSCKGIISPLYGHGVVREKRCNIYQELYKHVAELWVKNGITQHALTLFAHDQDVINTWFWMGFGLRCVDSIRKVSVINRNNSSLKIKKIDTTEIEPLAHIHRNHHLYYGSSPLFMPRMEEDPILDLREWFEGENHHLWVAYDHETPVGYMRIQPHAETFVSKHRSMMNITGAYVLETERKSGIASLLLDQIQSWLIENGYTLCGVDFESFNIEGSRFWNKYFTPYTHSLVRRIDENILDNLL